MNKFCIRDSENPNQLASRESANQGLFCLPLCDEIGNRIHQLEKLLLIFDWERANIRPRLRLKKFRFSYNWAVAQVSACPLIFLFGGTCTPWCFHLGVHVHF